MLALRGQMISRRASQRRKKPDQAIHLMRRRPSRAVLQRSNRKRKDALTHSRKATFF
jgi:hypothetical protein